MDIPKLRQLEALPAQIDDKQVVVLKDPYHYVDSNLVLSAGAAFLAQLMDGTRTWEDIQQAWSRATGEILPRHKLEEIVETLDRVYFLDNERFAQHRNQKQSASETIRQGK